MGKLGSRALAPAIILAALTLGARASAQCTPGTRWTQTWTDSYGQTTYEISAPCKVYVGENFTVELTVTDAAYPSTWVGGPWSILDNGATVASGSSVDTDATGRWTHTFTHSYSTLVVNHVIEFKFKDLGRGAGMSGWGDSVIGDLTVDPYPPAPPTADAGADLTLSMSDQATAVVEGAASDPYGEALTYRWLEGDAEVQAPRDVDETGAAPLELGALPALTAGTHVFTLEVSDGQELATDTVNVTVEEATAEAPGETPTEDPRDDVGCASAAGGVPSLAALLAVAVRAATRRRRFES